MTTLSEYLYAERFDRTEPAAFYLPGAERWGDLSSFEMLLLVARRHEVSDEIDPDEDEDGTFCQ